MLRLKNVKFYKFFTKMFGVLLETRYLCTR